MSRTAQDINNLIEQLYDEHASRMYHYALCMTGDRSRAEDVVQTVFVRIARNPQGVSAAQSSRSYLFTAVRNESLRMRDSREFAGRPFQLYAQAPDPAEREYVEAVIAALPQEQREVLVLKVFEELTFSEIAETLQISQNTAASRYRYACEKLREQWKM